MKMLRHRYFIKNGPQFSEKLFFQARLYESFYRTEIKLIPLCVNDINAMYKNTLKLHFQ